MPHPTPPTAQRWPTLPRQQLSWQQSGPVLRCSAAQGCLGHGGQGGEGNTDAPATERLASRSVASAPRSGGWPSRGTSRAKLLPLLQRDQQFHAARVMGKDNTSQDHRMFERLRDNALLIQKGLGSASPGAVADILGRVVDTLGDAARAIYLHIIIHASGYETALPRREALPPLALHP